jgi:hypothetical protein
MRWTIVSDITGEYYLGTKRYTQVFAESLYGLVPRLGEEAYVDEPTLFGQRQVILLKSGSDKNYSFSCVYR